MHHTHTFTLLPLLALLLACASTPPFAERSAPAPGEPAPVEVRERLPVVRALVGQETVELVFDLGSSHALTLPLDVLQRTGATPTGDHVRFTDAAGHALEAAVYRVPSLTWAGWTWRDVQAVEAVWSEDFAPPLRLGVLGRPLLDGLRLTFAPGQGLARLEPSQPTCGPNATALRQGGGLFIPVHIDDRSAVALLDSAATHDITTDPALAGPHALTLTEGHRVTVDLAHAPLDGLPADVLLGLPFLTATPLVIDLGAACVAPAPPR